MKPFTFARATDQQTASREAATKGTQFIAGGTNLIDLMKLDVEQPGRLVDINALPLKEIRQLPNGNWLIGALVKNTSLAYHPEIAKAYPVLSEAILSGASPQLRNMATTGGNLLQRTRCYYFYDPAFPCNKRQPGSGCSAIGGYNRNHAVLGGSDHCIATHPSDLCVALAALEPVIHLAGTKGPRQIPFSALHLLPGKTPQLEHSLRPGELITAVELPQLSFASRSSYLKVRDRASYEFALASAAVALGMQNGRIVQARVALGGVGTKPWRSPEAEKELIGAEPVSATFERAAIAALAGAIPRKDNGFKPELARRTLVRALITTVHLV